jgi:hypothetical protein
MFSAATLLASKYFLRKGSAITAMRGWFRSPGVEPSSPCQYALSEEQQPYMQVAWLDIQNQRQTIEA